MKKLIVSNPDILGGTPVIKGTRIPVERILFLIKEGFTLEGIQKMYPHISIKIFKEVMDELAKMTEVTKNASIA